MRVVVVTKDNTEYAREVSDYLRDFQAQTGHTLEVLNPESSEGVMFTGTYDIMQFPTLIAIADDGQIQQTWVGTPLPTINEVSYYV